MIAIANYEVGNLFSLSSSLTHIGIPHVITAKEEDFEKASHIILPGVGAFGDASDMLFKSGLADIILKYAHKKPLLGICVGAQLLFDYGYEFGKFKGLGLIPGDIVNIKEDMKEDLKIPHIGWNSLKFTQESPLFKHIKDGDYVYFVHSYHARTTGQYISSTSPYGMDITASVQNGNIFGTQFHPEKSGNVGLAILKAFYEYEM